VFVDGVVIRILSFEVVLRFPKVRVITLVLLDTPANARLQRCVRD
jgi:hypothetical protein